MEDVAGWIAPIATMLAAMITAANLGARITGWGFVVFLIGSLAWVAVAATSGQSNLLWSNLFLTAVNVVGIWRWLGRQAKLDDGAKAAAEDSVEAQAPDLFSAATLVDAALMDAEGARIGRVAGTMVECGSGRIAYLVVGEGGAGGVGERLHMLKWDEVEVREGALSTRMPAETLRARPEVKADEWPKAAGAHG